MTSTTSPRSPIELDERHVAELVTTDPRRAAVFERLGIDYCCGGNIPLAEACAERGLDLATVRDLLEHATSAPSDERDLAGASIEALVDEIVSRHHALLRTEMPRLTILAHKVATAHGARDATLVEAESIVVRCFEELRAHTDDEEQRVFPACVDADRGVLDPDDATTLADALGQLVREHDEAGGHLARLRRLLDDFEPPLHACTSWRAYLDGLERLEQDVHRHVHKENHILFPKVMDRLYAAEAAR